MLKEFTLPNIAALDDGRVATAYAQALGRVLADCADRPGCTTSRQVSLRMKVTPVMNENGDLEETKVAFQVTDSIPTRESKVYSMDIRRVSSGDGRHQRQLVFNDLAEDNVDQRTFDETPGFMPPDNSEIKNPDAE